QQPDGHHHAGEPDEKLRMTEERSPPLGEAIGAGDQALAALLLRGGPARGGGVVGRGRGHRSSPGQASAASVPSTPAANRATAAPTNGWASNTSRRSAPTPAPRVVRGTSPVSLGWS